MKVSRIPIIASLVIIIGFFIPIFYLYFGFATFSFGKPTESFLRLVTSPQVTSGLFNSLFLGFVGGGLGIIWGFAYSWIVWRTNVPFKKVLHYLPFFGFLMPEVIKAIGWVILFGPNAGVINKMFFPLLHGPLFNVATIWGMTLVLSFSGIHITYLTLSPAVAGINPSLEESSRIHGRSTLGTFLRVSLPVLTPAVLGAYLLSALWGLSNLDYPLIIGPEGRLNFLSFSTYFYAQESQPPNFADAMYVGIFYILITVATLGVYVYFTRRLYRFVTLTGVAPRPTVHNLGHWRWGALATCIIILIVGWGLLLGILIWTSLSTGGVVSTTLTLANYSAAFSVLSGFWTSVLNTLELGAFTGIVGAILAVLISYAAFRSFSKWSRLIDTLAMLPMAIPGIVYGLALFLMFLFIPGHFGSILYGSVVPLLIANVFVYLPHMVRQSQGWTVQVSTELEEASRVLGRSWLGTMGRILLPLYARGMINVVLYGFADAFRELGAIILLVTPQFLISVVLIYNYFGEEPYAINEVAAAGVVIAILIAILIFASQYLAYRRSAWQRV